MAIMADSDGFDVGVSTIALDGASGTQTLLKGDLINIAGSGQYVVTANATSTTGVFAEVNIYPPLRTAVADGDVVTKVGEHEMNIAGDLRGISLAVVPLALPMEAGRGATMSYQGLSVRVVMGYDQQTKSDTISFDLLCGGKVSQPELVTRFI
jgi:hypothetical protein